MINKPLVSVIIIFFNSEKFIEEAIKSVFAQSYEHWELLLVDDGSTDSSSEIALTYVRTHPDKVHYLEHEGHQNCGMSATRNLGIRHAKGKYIALLDSDDVWLPQKLEQQVAIMEAQLDAHMIYGPSQKWYSWTGKPEDTDRDCCYKLDIEGNTLVHPPVLVTLCLQGKTSSPCPSNILFRRSLIEMVGGFEEEWKGIYQLYEDQVFLSKVFLHKSVYVSEECWSKYRKHSDSCVSTVKQAGKENIVRLAFLKWLEKYLTDKDIQNHDIWQTIFIEKLFCNYSIISHFLNKIRHFVYSRK